MNGNNDSNSEEIFGVMGQLKDKFNALISGNISLDRYNEEVESEHFRGSFTQFAPSGGSLNPGGNLVSRDGVATVTQDIRFQIRIFPKNVNNPRPLRIEVDSPHRVGSNKIIHINPAGGGRMDVPSDIVEEIMPDNCIDLVRISGASHFREAINQSLEHWGV